ncbi:hypothetical protein RGU12_21150 [Fredinandcohnia sp. QZ13]|uniref:hypothetical protein n=1 Tax=Fredinandcohnia sp. QZ13 TaxID=3073144 RepID=UPI0028531B2E|nr:hypothetical protein [Fredinandcohnia sp. QZ13]MDR4890008.1 hypothetical protein [Fredinandcohnia sp. QZ13]
MKIESVIRLVNIMVSEKNYPNARNMIINEWNRLTEAQNYVLLHSNAQQFLKIIKEELEQGTFGTLSDSDKKVLILVNRYIKDLQFRTAKRICEEHQVLLERPEAQKWLTSEARYIYEVWKKSV